jgi:HD-GYP domain-containing protein (c-di-GMP phosphodiesterase class II)
MHVETAYDNQLDTLTAPNQQAQTPPCDVEPTLPKEAHQTLRTLERAFGQEFSVIDCATGQLLCTAPQSPPIDLYNRLPICEQVVRRGRPAILDECIPLLLLAVPLVDPNGEGSLVAVGTFITEDVESVAEITAAAREFGIGSDQAFRWAAARTPWNPDALLEIGTAIAERTALQQLTIQLKRQVTDISSHLLMTFEEITLLHRLTEHLSISKSVTDLCELAVDWLGDVIPAKSVAIWFESACQVDGNCPIGESRNRDARLIAYGDCPLACHEIAGFMERLGPQTATELVLLNRSSTSAPNWFFPSIRDFISVPIREGDRFFGWLLSLNHTGKENVPNSKAEFGTVEACLMASVATILGVHCGNVALYGEQSEFFGSVMQALTSAIDAKDAYTCGHSERVAQIAVCLARQLGCSEEDLNTIYLSGLLHDIGKIGIDDSVLRKPGALTPAEFEHIKTHPDLGNRILDGVKQLDKVLPAVRHHHEAWNGTGYPGGLKEEETPLLARIVAVADSIDAMSSDRHYRKSMSDEDLDAILREGAGKQWDPKVVDAAFQVRESVRRIREDAGQPLSLDSRSWQAGTLAGQPAAV